MKSLSLKEKLIYATGNMGVGLMMAMHMLFLVYFFFPSNVARLPYLIPQGSLFMGLTLLGIILFTSRIFDAITDPLIASLSDRSRFKSGKRIPFMRIAAIPMALSYVLVFFVPVLTGITTLNVIWFSFFMFISVIFITMYTIPYYTLIVDMAHTSEEKVDLGTYSSAFWFAGFLLASMASSLWEPLELGLTISRVESIRFSFVIIGIIASICMLVPALLINESNYETSTTTQKVSFTKAIKTVSKNKSFLAFLIGNVVYNVATYIFETGLLYFITVLALLNEEVQGPLTTIIGVLTLLSYPFVNKFAKRFGKKPIMLIGFVLFAFSFIVVTAFGLWGVNPYYLLIVLAVLVPFSQAAFGILPTVMTADCAAYDKRIRNEENSGMYVAAMSFSSKLGGSIATILFTSLLILGKDVGNDFGIRAATILAAVLSMIGFIIMLGYDEKKILNESEMAKGE